MIDNRTITKDKAKKILLPTNDFIFKGIYGKKGSERITEAFIKAFLDLEVTIDKLEDSKALDIESVEKKASILDVLLTNKDGSKINLEMQVGNYSNLEERFCFYGLELFTEQYKSGMKYEDVNKVLCVIILKDDYVKYSNFDKYKMSWQFREEDYHDLILTDKIEFCIISLEKIKKKIANGEISDKEKITIWTKFLLTPQKLKEEEMEENQEVKQANEKYNEMLGDDNTRRLALKRQLALMEMDSARGDGIKEGKKEDAKNMLKENFDIETISRITGLTKEEIEQLK